jgi:hypothetical protein
LKRQSIFSNEFTYCLNASSFAKSIHCLVIQVLPFNIVGAYHSLNRDLLNASSQLLTVSKKAFLISLSNVSTSQPCSCAYKYLFTLLFNSHNLTGLIFLINSSAV